MRIITAFVLVVIGAALIIGTGILIFGEVLQQWWAPLPGAVGFLLILVAERIEQTVPDQLSER